MDDLADVGPVAQGACSHTGFYIGDSEESGDEQSSSYLIGVPFDEDDVCRYQTPDDCKKLSGDDVAKNELHLVPLLLMMMSPWSKR